MAAHVGAEGDHPELPATPADAEAQFRADVDMAMNTFVARLHALAIEKARRETLALLRLVLEAFENAWEKFWDSSIA